MGGIRIDDQNCLTFFAVLVRMSTVAVLMPIIGDRMVPVPVKILFSLALTLMIYPVLVASGALNPNDALVWGSTMGGLATVIGLEAVFGLVLGFVSRLTFDLIQIAGDIAGNFMGFASASMFDPHQETQTQVVSRIYLALATLLFLALDGHHVVLMALSKSYQFVGLGKATLSAALGQSLLEITKDSIKVGLQIAAPLAITFFCVNVVYGVISKSMPQMNILVLSFSVSALVGLFVMWSSMPEFVSVSRDLFDGLGEELAMVMKAMGR